MADKASKLELTSTIPGNIVVHADSISNILSDHPYVNLEQNESVVVFGDIHGSPTFLRAYGLMRREFPNSTFVFLGDIVDRGPDSVKILQFLMDETKAGRKNHYLTGNHEKKLLETLDVYFKDGTVPEVGSLAGYATFRDIVSPWYGKTGVSPEHARDKAKEIAEFLRSFEDFMVLGWLGKRCDDVLLSHAPFIPFMENRFRGINRSDTIYGMEDFRGPNSKEPDVSFVNALDTICAENRLKAVSGHVDFSEAVQKSGSKRVRSIEGQVNSGGDIIALVIKNGEFVSERLFDSLVGTSGTFFDNKTIETDFKKNFAPLEESKHVSASSGHHKYGGALSLRKYSKRVFYDRLWGSLSPESNTALEKARGIVLDRLGLPVSYPFDKVFNLGEEVSGIPTSLAEGDYEFVEKKNGFMAVVSPDPFDFTNLLVHTQGSLAEGQFKSYVDSLLSGADRARIKNWYRINGPHTLIFEALHPEDKHIVEYGPEDFGLCLIGCRDLSPNGGYRVLSETELDEIASTVGFSRPTRFVAPLSEIMTLRKTSKNMEGWMVRDIKTGAHLSKIKTAHYLVTKFLGRMSEGNWKFLMTNKQGFVEKNQIDEEFLPPRRLRVRQSGAIL